MAILHDSGIVLTSFPLKEKDQIIALFTRARGLVKAYVKGKIGRANPALITPFTQGEYFLKQGSSDLWQLTEGSIISQNLGLRENYDILECAGKMVQFLMQTQELEKPAPDLYTLFSLFLEHLPQAKELTTFLAIFILKLLKHEGILQLDLHCSHCHASLSLSFRYKGACYCKKHAPQNAVAFTLQEEKQIDALQAERSMSLLKETMVRELAHKIILSKAE